MKTKPIYRTYPIERIDEEQRIVEGYAFVNEIVPGEGGIRLKRSAMEAATANYLANGTSRELHQPSAAGKPVDVFWDEKGALLRVKVVDDQAWAKVKEGVYKGFSVGVIPEVMRGKDVEKCNWWDSSLVDVGKDKDAKFTLWRSQDIEADQEFEVVVERASFSDYLQDCSPSELRDMALDYLWNSLWDIQYNEASSSEEKTTAVEQTCDEFKEFMQGVLSSGLLPPITADVEEPNRSISTPVLLRMFDAEAELAAMQEHAAATADAAEETSRSLSMRDIKISALERQVESSAAQLVQVQRAFEDALKCAADAEGKVKELGAQPRSARPVLVAELVERSTGPTADQVERLASLDSELAALNTLPPTADTNEGLRRVTEIQRIKREQVDLLRSQPY